MRPPRSRRGCASCPRDERWQPTSACPPRAGSTPFSGLSPHPSSRSAWTGSSTPTAGGRERGSSDASSHHPSTSCAPGRGSPAEDPPRLVASYTVQPFRIVWQAPPAVKAWIAAWHRTKNDSATGYSRGRLVARPQRQPLPAASEDLNGNERLGAGFRRLADDSRRLGWRACSRSPPPRCLLSSFRFHRTANSPGCVRIFGFEPAFSFRASSRARSRRWLARLVDGSSFYRREHDGIGVEHCMEVNAALAWLLLLINDERLLDVIRSITGCASIGHFDGRVYRLAPSTDHHGTRGMTTSATTGSSQ